MIKIDLEDWEEADLKGRIVERISNTIISREFKLYGDIPDEGCYTPYDKFKNYVANLVADRIFKYMVDNPEIRKRIDTAIDKAEKSIVATTVKIEGQVNRKRLIDAEELIKGRVENDPVRIAVECTPTAFDKEKVIEKLKDQYNYSREVRNENDNNYFEYWDGRTDSYKDAIEIVEKGGIDG